MHQHQLLAEQFEASRAHLQSVAYRMLGSLSEAEDAVQESWLRLSRSDTSNVENMTGWLTTVTARVCLDMLRSRKARREEPLASHVPDPIISSADDTNPEQQALLADSVGLALLVVLDKLTPAERLAFVLHDSFAVPFDEIAPIVGRSPAATRQLASRARRRVQGTAKIPDPDLGRQRAVVDAFLAAAREGNFEALLETLDPDVVVRFDHGALPAQLPGVMHGIKELTEKAFGGRAAQFAQFARLALVNGAAGLVFTSKNGRPISVAGITVSGGKIVEINILADPERLKHLDLTILD